MLTGFVIKLDRGYPLVHASDGNDYRCEHAIALVKGNQLRAVIGDQVEISIPEGHDKGIIEKILPRKNQLIRKDPTEQAIPQVLAANFTHIFIAQPIHELNYRRLERELVLAYETGVDVTVILTKADLLEDEERAQTVISKVQELVSADKLIVASEKDEQGIQAIKKLIPEGEVAILVGKSGVGKSSLVNMLMGSHVQETTAVREADGKGRHTTVSREAFKIPGGGYVVDMPGIRGLGLWDAESGIEAAFSDIEELAKQCKFRDCKHVGEPGCAVARAVKKGDIAEARFLSYQALKKETKAVKEHREESDRMRSRKGHPRRRKFDR